MHTYVYEVILSVEGVFQVKSEVCIWHGVDLDAVPGAHVILLNVLVEPFDEEFLSLKPLIMAIKANNDKRYRQQYSREV